MEGITRNHLKGHGFSAEVMQRLQAMIDAAALKPKVPSRAKLEKLRRTKSGPRENSWKSSMETYIEYMNHASLH